MLFGQDKDDDKNDFFDGPDLPDPEKKAKPPVLHPDDPKYWDREESAWEHLRPASRNRVWWWVAAAGIIAGLAVAFWLRYCSPYIDEATQYGYVESIDKRGTVFKTYEGVLIPYREIMDTTRVYRRDFVFTAQDARVATRLYNIQRAGMPAEVRYKVYHATLPWRGASKIIVVSADTADAAKILPPEFAPAIAPGPRRAPLQHTRQ